MLNNDSINIIVFILVSFGFGILFVSFNTSNKEESKRLFKMSICIIVFVLLVGFKYNMIGGNTNICDNIKEEIKLSKNINNVYKSLSKNKNFEYKIESTDNTLKEYNVSIYLNSQLKKIYHVDVDKDGTIKSVN